MQENDFFTWRRAMLLRFQEMAAAEDVYTELQYQTQRLEFDYYALCVRHPVPFTRPKISLRTTYPPAWVTHYQSENYFAIDPVLKPENFRQGHLHWDDVLFHEAQAMWDAAQRFGLRRGVTQCVMLPNRALGFLSFSRSSLRCSSFTYDEVELRLQLLARESLSALTRFEDDMVMAPEMRFSKREKEILKWTAEGKTSSEIAIILSISENTVNFHQKNMQKKFNAPNKTQIACYAAPQEVVSAIRSVYSGQRYIASDIAQQMALSQIEPAKTETPFASLSERELQIMLMITKGQKVNEISEQLNLSPKTVNSYRYRMFSKLNIHGDVELTHLAIRHGLCNAETLTSQ
ncbi:transcriptional regulator SdiA [Salmonella enterica subsp. enterica serovar Enteritidis]|nr:transcriptional regulator SdiA [Salmonella enterica subsp. enterica serovar Enteritidis]